MLIREICEARLPPQKDVLAIMSTVLDDVNREYTDYLNSNSDQDNIQELADLLNSEIDTYDLPIEFDVNPLPRQDPNEHISAEAGQDADGENFMTIWLHEFNLNGTWGPKTFKSIVLKALGHETIHWNQYARMGDAVGKTKSGHQKGSELVQKGGTARDWKRSYLRDPHELMAYGHDLAGEIMDTTDPAAVLRNPDAYTADLPTWNMFREIFPKDTPQIKQLLKYAVGYIQDK